MPLRPCLDGPELTDRTDGRCAVHASQRNRQRDARRGTRQQRGYDRAHDGRRARWAPVVAKGGVACWRCGLLIASGEAWDLGHLDDGSGRSLPEHATVCNRAAGGRAAHHVS